jgi:predicted AAA+ superfamily ATPase
MFQTLTTPVGWATLKKGTDVAGPSTIEEYALSLESSFVMNIIHRMNALTRKPEYAKDKKIVFGDPFFIHALHAWVSGKKPFEFAADKLNDPVEKANIIEQVVGGHCIRLAFSLAEQKQLFDPKTQVMFWRSREDREIDFVVLGNSNMIPIEVKYQDQIARTDLFAMADFRKVTRTKGGIMLSKGTLEGRDGYSIVPVSTFLLLV